jgi:hypothetical protein
MIPADANREAADLIANIKRLLDAARSGLEMEGSGRTQWRSSTMDLAKALLAGRELCQGDTKTFHRWLSDKGLGEGVLTAHERAGLIGIAEHPAVAERVLAKTAKRSWKTIWLDEIKPEVDALKRVVTPDNSARGGRPRKAPIQSNEPIEDVVERALIAKCSDPEWRVIDKMASTVNRAPNFVRDIIKRLKARGLVEQRKAADSTGIEYRIIAPVERDAPPDVEALKRQIDDLEFAGLEKDERIAELEGLLEAARSEIAGLRERIAQRESIEDAGQHSPDESIESKPETVH